MRIIASMVSVTASTTFCDGGTGFSLSIRRPHSGCAHALSRMPVLYCGAGSSHGTNLSWMFAILSVLSSAGPAVREAAARERDHLVGGLREGLRGLHQRRMRVVLVPGVAVLFVGPLEVRDPHELVHDFLGRIDVDTTLLELDVLGIREVDDLVDERRRTGDDDVAPVSYTHLRAHET